MSNGRKVAEMNETTATNDILKWKAKRKNDGKVWKERTMKYRKRMEMMLAAAGKDKE